MSSGKNTKPGASDVPIDRAGEAALASAPVVHEEPTEGGSYRRHPATGVLTKVVPVAAVVATEPEPTAQE
jgi:hypothetical protein